MANASASPSRMEILVLSSLIRRPMHGYELKLELRYKHVSWWAKCEHGHLYATLQRLAKRGDIEPVDDEGGQARKVFRVSAVGRERLRRAVIALGESDESVYFDVDLFLASAFTLEKRETLQLLVARRERTRAQHAAAIALEEKMRPHVPTSGKLIMRHRIEHLALEARFLDDAVATLEGERAKGPFLGDKPIAEFVRETGVPVEDATKKGARTPSAPRRHARDAKRAPL